MRIVISGICGFVGSTVAQALAEAGGYEIAGFDNFIRPGSELNRAHLSHLGVKLFHADLRAASDLEVLPGSDWVIDAAANPSVLAGVDGRTSSRQLVEHNLSGTLNLLEYCKHHRAGFVLLSTSRVYGITPLAELPVDVVDHAYVPSRTAPLPTGLSRAGVTEAFATGSPISLYGATKLASEVLALEYGDTFGFPVYVNRCGVLAGAGQFGRPDQGIFAFWINRFLRRLPLRYLGFGGTGHQVRDCLHPRDLVPLLRQQFANPPLSATERTVNVSGGADSAMSLRQLSAWCEEHLGRHAVEGDHQPRRFDIPWMVLDSSAAAQRWHWRPLTPIDAILDEIAAHAHAHPRWLEISAAY